MVHLVELKVLQKFSTPLNTRKNHKFLIMATKFKSTPFARFFVAMLLIAPLAYIGASYMNGQDGLQNIKNLFTGNQTTVMEDDIAHSNQETTETTYSLEQLQQDLKEKEMRIEELEQENEALKRENEALEEQLNGEDSQ